MTDESYIYVADLLTGLVVFAGLGWFVKHYWNLGFWPIGLGIVSGLAVGIAMMLLRYNNDSKGISEKDNYFRVNVQRARAKREADKKTAAQEQDARKDISKEESEEYQRSIAYRTDSQEQNTSVGDN